MLCSPVKGRGATAPQKSVSGRNRFIYLSILLYHMTPEQPMKVIYFERSGKAWARGFYVPSEDVILYAKMNSLVDAPVYDEILDGVRSIARGNNAPKNFRNVSEVKYDASRIMALIQDARLRAELDKKVDTGIEELLEQVK